MAVVRTPSCRLVRESPLGRLVLALFAIASIAAHGAMPDAPVPQAAAREPGSGADHAGGAPASYREALAAWRSAEDVNAWIGRHFRYDGPRALKLSESWRQRNPSLPIHAPEVFFADPHGVCVDLARFAVETLRTIDPASKPAYLMIEFDAAMVEGETLRRHWIATFERDGRRHFFADSRRPGHLAGPYPSTEAFVADYAAFRGRRVVAYREADDYARRARAMAARRPSAPSPPH